MPARSPLVTHIFVPLITYSSPSRTARHADVAGVAAGVGLRQRQAAAQLARRHARAASAAFCSSVPCVHDQVAAIVCVLTMPDSDIQP